MKKFFMFVLAALHIEAQAQSIPLFSDISNRICGDVDLISVVVEDGIIYSFMTERDLLPPPNGINVTTRRFYKIDFNGNLKDSLFLPPAIYRGDFVKWGDRVLFSGFRNDFENLSTSGMRKIIIEMDENLTISDVIEFPDVAPLAGVAIMQSMGSADAGVSTYIQYCSHAIYGDTLFSINNYVLADPITYMPIGIYCQWEHTDLLNGKVWAEPMPSTYAGYRSSVLTPNYGYVFGDVGGIPLPGGGILNNTGVVRFDHRNSTAASFAFHPQFLWGNLSLGAFSQYSPRENRIYCAYSNQGVTGGLPGCQNGYTVIVDVRDEAFNLHKRIALPDCQAGVMGKRLFAFPESGGAYFYAGVPGQRYLYKFDDELNIIWKKPAPPPPGLFVGLQVLESDNGNVVIEILEPNPDISTNVKLKLYKYNSSGDLIAVDSIDRPISVPSQFRFGPVPFKDYLQSVELNGNQVWIQLHDLSGRLLKSEIVQDGVLYTPDLPEAMYILTVRSIEDGRLLHTQKVVKAR